MVTSSFLVLYTEGMNQSSSAVRLAPYVLLFTMSIAPYINALVTSQTR